jgi:hypothetical protein
MAENFYSQTGTLGSWGTNAPDDFDWTGESSGLFPVTRLRQQYIDYLAAKAPEYEEQRLHRHYFHAAQWTAEQVRILRDRKQPIVTYNRVARKINSVTGLLQRIRQDPKAYPTNPKSAMGAEVATLAVRSVLKKNTWQTLDPMCAKQAATEGIGGVGFKLVRGDHADPDIGMEFVFGDDFFYDPRSAKPDFSDGRFHGIAKWIDVEAAIELFPDKEEELRTLMVETGFDLTTHADREFKWIYVNEKRVRLVEHWYRAHNRWYWAFYCSLIMLAQGVSYFRDENNVPMSRFVMFSAEVDHDGDRYGLIRNLKGPQDELNQRHSKALFMSNVTAQRIAKGAVDDIETARKERARPDGVIEYNPGFQPPEDISNMEDLQAHLSLMQDARQEIDSFANILPNILMGPKDASEQSGVAINLLQKAGISELGGFFVNYKDWKLRVYKAAWNICKTTWKSERWIRVSGRDEIAQFLQVNGEQRDQWGRPTFINMLGDIGAEIGFDDGPDVENLMQETFDLIKQDPNIPWQIKLQFMPIGDSERRAMQQAMAQPPPLSPEQQQGVQLDLHKKRADIADKYAQVAERRARSVKDVASAAHLGHEANLNTAEFVRSGITEATTDQPPGEGGANPQTQQQLGQQPPPRTGPSSPGMGGVPQRVPMAQQQPPGFGGGMPMQPQNQPGIPVQRPLGRAPGNPWGAVSVPPNHPILAHARLARDGRHYLPDPRRPGKYLRVGG